ncbi:MAG: response regulator transcription factor [Spirochaetales bacterium]|nr:response regulator transcription factor [Spirochaetales bacterium]
MAGERVLIVDDEADIRELIAKYLKKESMDVSEAENGFKALALLERGEFDLVILDLMMKGLDGFETLKRIRAKNQALHVMIVSAREEDYDKILGLGLGADDYLTKPFSPGELVARVKSQLRRLNLARAAGGRGGASESVAAGGFLLDLKAHRAFRGDRELGLSAREFRLLKLFLENPGRVFTKRQIYAAAWDDGYFDENTLMVYISHLRDKIEDDPGAPRRIVTVWGIGYRFDPGVSPGGHPSWCM